MPTGSSFEVHAIYASIRFIQRYRYLDRCGEALVKLENVLAEGWIPAESSPKSGSMKNDELGMTATFGSDAMTVTQRRKGVGSLLSACQTSAARWARQEQRLPPPFLDVGGFAAFVGGFFLPGVDGLKLLVAGIAMCAFGLKIGEEFRAASE